MDHNRIFGMAQGVVRLFMPLIRPWPKKDLKDSRMREIAKRAGIDHSTLHYVRDGSCNVCFPSEVGIPVRDRLPIPAAKKATG